MFEHRPNAGPRRARPSRPEGEVRYSVDPTVTTVVSALRGLKSKTGRSLEEWVRLVRSEGPPEIQGRRQWLRERHGLGASYARWIAERADGRADEVYEEKAYLAAAPRWVDEMFDGPRARLRPIYATLIEALSLGDDVRICPRRALVPVFRRHVFAEIRPALRRIDLGLALRTTPVSSRLVPAGTFGRRDRITHRIAIGSREEVDEEVRRWARIAYDMDAPVTG